MKKSEAIRRAKSGRKLAAILGVTPQAVYAWGDDLPKMRCYQLKVLKPSWFRNGKARP